MNIKQWRRLQTKPASIVYYTGILLAEARMKDGGLDNLAKGAMELAEAGTVSLVQRRVDGVNEYIAQTRFP